MFGETEKIREGAVLSYLKVLASVCLEGLGKTMKTFRIVSVPARD
jgi:hypothetical protein